MSTLYKIMYLYKIYRRICQFKNIIYNGQCDIGFSILRDEKYRCVLNGERKEKIKYVKEKDGSTDEKEREGEYRKG